MTDSRKCDCAAVIEALETLGYKMLDPVWRVGECEISEGDTLFLCPEAGAGA